THPTRPPPARPTSSWGPRSTARRPARPRPRLRNLPPRRSDRLPARLFVPPRALAAQPALPDHPAQLARPPRPRATARVADAFRQRGAAARLRRRRHAAVVSLQPGTTRPRTRQAAGRGAARLGRQRRFLLH